MPLKLSLSKSERLKSKKSIESLFKSGDSFYKFPLKLVYQTTELRSDVPAKAAFSVPKKNIKTAVKRNLIRRRIKEAYRLNKSPLLKQLTTQEKSLICMFIFVGKEVSTYQEIEQAVKYVINKMEKKLDKLGLR